MMGIGLLGDQSYMQTGLVCQIWKQVLFAKYGDRSCLPNMETGLVCQIWRQVLFAKYEDRSCLPNMETGLVCQI